MNARKYLAGLTAACLMMTALLGGTASADSVTVTADRLNLRAEESVSSKAVGVVEEGDVMSFVAESGDWYQVKNGKKTGFVMKEYVKIDKTRIAADVAANTVPCSGTAKTTDRVNLRRLPMTDADVVKVIAKKAEVQIIGQCGVWYQVSCSGKTGYLMAQYLKVESIEGAENGGATVAPGNPSDGDILYAAQKTGKATDRVNLREEPSTGADVVKVVSRNSVLTILGERGVWYRVEVGGRQGYISKPYVSLISSSEEEAGSQDSETLYAAAVPGEATERVNMREEPSTSAKVARILDEDDGLSVLGECGDWYKVSCGGKEGYVFKEYICLTGAGDDNSGADAVVPEGFVGYPAARTGSVTKRVNLREGASTSADVICVLDADESVLALGEMGNFYQVKCDSGLGYVSKDYVRLGTTSDGGSADNEPAVDDETIYETTRAARATVKVNMRRSPEGDVLFVLPEGTQVTLIGEAGGWYKVIYSSSTGYISKAYLTENQTSAPVQPESTVKPETTPDTSGQGTTAYVTGDSVNLRKGPSTGYGVVKVLRKGDEITFYSLTDGWYLIKAGGDTGYISSKYVSTVKPETAPSNPGGDTSGDVQVGKVRNADWWTSDIQDVFARGVIATITDVDTGLSWQVKRTGGTNHADVQPLTAADTAKMKKAYGGSWSWNRRAIWVTIDGVTYAASQNGMPHGGGDSIPNNNFDGHHCIHFLNSRTHTGNRWDTAHQSMVQKAYKAGQ